MMLMYDIYSEALKVAQNLEEATFLGEARYKAGQLERYEWLQGEALMKGAQLPDWRELLEREVS